MSDESILPRLVLAAADLDVLELQTGNALPHGVSLTTNDATVATAQRVLLTDAENTPLAIFEADAEAPSARGQQNLVRPGSITALRSRAVGSGPAWDPVARRAARDVRAEVGEDAGATLAIAFSAPPTEAELELASGAIATLHPSTVLWVALVASVRSVRGSAAKSDDLARAVFARLPPGAIPLIVPSGWRESESLRPRQPGGSEPDSSAILAAYGATHVIETGSGRGADEARAAVAVVPDGVAALGRHPGPTVGAVVLFTGLSGSGKSTVARALADRLEVAGTQPVVLLDGDELRQALSSELGFDRRSRELNLQRVGYVASLLAGVGALALVAPIAPFEASRAEIRRRVESHSRFVLVYVATPLAVCEERDRKGLYARARSGDLPDFTGVSSPYEVPADADVTIDTSRQSVAECVSAVLEAMRESLATPSS